MQVKIFFSYAREDQKDMNALKKHLMGLENQGLVEMWYDQNISAGTEWELEITNQLNTANIILLLISPNFMASEYCYSKEMQRAMERHERGEARVIPIILRQTLWQNAPFSKLQALPPAAKPVVHPSWRKAQAFFTVAEGIRVVVEELSKEMPTSKAEQQHFISDPKDIIIEILSIIEYEDDKEAYAYEFIDLCEKQALVDCLQALPPDKQVEFKQKMLQARDQEEVKAIIVQYVSADQYTEALKLASQIAFTKFIETLLPELTDRQINQLEGFLAFISRKVVSQPPPDLSNIPASTIFLSVEQGKNSGQIYKLDKASLRIGRAETNDIVLEDPEISDFHASLFDMGDGNYTLRDEGSTNGTKVNHQLVPAHQLYTLREWDKIQLAQTQLLFAVSRSLKKTLADASVREYDFFDEEDISAFIDNLQDERENLEITSEDQDSLAEQLDDTVNTHLVNLLSDEDQEELDKLLDEDPTDEELEKFFQQKIPNLRNEITRALLNFKYNYSATSTTQKLGSP